MTDELVISNSDGVYMLELAPDATAPALTRLRICHVEKPGQCPLTVAELLLSTLDLEALGDFCARHAKRARPHLLAAIEAIPAAGVARGW